MKLQVLFVKLMLSLEGSDLRNTNVPPVNKSSSVAHIAMYTGFQSKSPHTPLATYDQPSELTGDWV